MTLEEHIKWWLDLHLKIADDEDELREEQYSAFAQWLVEQYFVRQRVDSVLAKQK